MYVAAVAKDAGLWDFSGGTTSGQQDKALAAALVGGALAPDAGYYPKADREMARLAHGEKAVELALALADIAVTGPDKAFVLGWASHLHLDVRGHAELVDPAAGSTYADDPLAHTRVEWGVDCRLLGQEQNLWLWSLFPRQAGGISLWHRALCAIGCRKFEPEALEKALLGEFKVVASLSKAWRRLGLVRKPGASDPAGRLLGLPARKALAAYFRLTGDKDRLAAATPRPPAQASWEKWLVILGGRG